MRWMKPKEERVPDTQYQALLKRILREGVPVMPQQGEGALHVLGHQMRFPFANGFPLITERDLSGTYFMQALGELSCFLNGGRTQAELEQFGCKWWKRWTTKEKCEKRGLAAGDLGPGSYGAAFRSFPTAEGVPFDQMKHLVEQIRELPHLRTHFVSPWIPQYIGRGKGKQQQVVVAPCHGWLHVLIYPAQKELSVHHFQRSADAPVGLVFNIAQYAAFAMILAHVMGYTPRELVYTVSDMHIYESQILHVRRLLSRTPRPFPTATLNESITDLFMFRAEHLSVTDYHPHPAMTIPTPV